MIYTLYTLYLTYTYPKTNKTKSSKIKRQKIHVLLPAAATVAVADDMVDTR